MCIVKIETNVSASDIDKMLLVNSTESLASTFKKPKTVSISLIILNNLKENDYLNVIIHFSIIYYIFIIIFRMFWYLLTRASLLLLLVLKNQQQL